MAIYAKMVADAFKGSFGDYTNAKTFTLPNIHVYGFSKARDPEFEFQEVLFLKIFFEHSRLSIYPFIKL